MTVKIKENDFIKARTFPNEIMRFVDFYDQFLWLYLQLY